MSKTAKTLPKETENEITPVLVYCSRGDLTGTLVDGRAVQSHGVAEDNTAIQLAAVALGKSVGDLDIASKEVYCAFQWANVIGAAEILATGHLGSGFAAALQVRALGGDDLAAEEEASDSTETEPDDDA